MTSATSMNATHTTESAYPEYPEYPTSLEDPRIAGLESNIRDGICAVIKTTTQLESCMWTYLRNNPPSSSTGFMFSSDAKFKTISDNMKIGHSGGSYVCTMRELQFIATNGLDAFMTLVTHE